MTGRRRWAAFSESNRAAAGISHGDRLVPGKIFRGTSWGKMASFDGVYKNSQAVQQLLSGKRPEWICSFDYDISEKVFSGKWIMEISVKVIHTISQISCRCLKGSGYHKMVGDGAGGGRILLHGIFFHAYGDDGKRYQVEISHELLNESDKKWRFSWCCPSV